MPSKRPMVTVFGGSGFLGRVIVQELAEAGYAVTIASREPERGSAAKVSGFPGQICMLSANIRHQESVARAVQGADAVVNAVGILFGSGKQSFAAIHAQGAERVAKAAKAAGAKSLVHVSALGIDKAGSSKYARTKASGEKAVLAAFPEATILRPSVIFGPEDNFINQFAQMAMFSPLLPLIGGGTTRFQPVYAADVARAVARAVAQPEARGQTYELGGPKVYTFKEILEYIQQETGRKRSYLRLPFPLASLMGRVMELLPVPPLTADQVELLKYSNTVTPGRPGLMELGITPAALEAIAPLYLTPFRKKKVVVVEGAMQERAS